MRMLCKQRTIARETEATQGVSLHSGHCVKLSLRPGQPDSGIIFRRTDLKPHAEVCVTAENIVDTRLATTVAFGRAHVLTIEHLMSAFASLGIDNIEVDIDGPELPGMDGSAAPFILMIKNAGVVEQPAYKRLIRIEREVEVVCEDPQSPSVPRRARFRPYNGLRFRVSIDFRHPYISTTDQSAQFEFGNDFEKEVSRARTFGFVEDIECLRDQGLALGGSFDNCVVLDGYRVLNSDGLRYPNEFARHKLLDAVGDCYVSGHHFIGEYEAYKPGHEINNLLVRKLLATEGGWSWVDGREVERMLAPPASDRSFVLEGAYGAT